MTTNDRIAFQGELGAYSHLAAAEYFSADSPVLACTEFSDTFKAVEDSKASHAIIPVENSVAGSIVENYDLLRTSGTYISGEYSLRIQHSLIVTNTNITDEVTKVYSHPQALAQCTDFIEESLPNAEVIPYYDTAGAAQLVARNPNEKWAAIASELAAPIYDVKVLKNGIENHPNNYTRFLVIQKLPNGGLPSTTYDKTSIVYKQKNSDGLQKTLAIFSSNEINISKVELRPQVGEPWRYWVFLDLEGSSEVVTECIEQLNLAANEYKILGNYQAHQV